MSILDRYARLPVTERRTKSVGSKLEPALYESFLDHCTKRGLTTSEALRYIIMDLLQEEVGTKSNQSYEKLPSSTKSEPLSTTPVTKSNKVKKKSNRGNSMLPWMVNDLLPCPLCDPPRWITRTNYARHVKTHGYQIGYEMIQANLEAAEQMVKEKKEVISNE